MPRCTARAATRLAHVWNSSASTTDRNLAPAKDRQPLAVSRHAPSGNDPGWPRNTAARSSTSGSYNSRGARRDSVSLASTNFADPSASRSASSSLSRDHRRRTNSAIRPARGRAFEARDDETREHVRVRELVHAERGVERARALAVHQKTLVAGEGVGEGDAGGERDERSRGNRRASAAHRREHGDGLDRLQTLGRRGETARRVFLDEQVEERVTVVDGDGVESKSAGTQTRAASREFSTPRVRRGSNRRRVRVREGASRRPRTPGTARGDVQHGRVRRAEKRREPTPTILEGIRGARNRLGTRLGNTPRRTLPAAARTPRLCARRARARRRARERAATRPKCSSASGGARAISFQNAVNHASVGSGVEGSVLASTTRRGRRAHSRGGHARRKRPRKLRR